jgi:hypothetical protein
MMLLPVGIRAPCKRHSCGGRDHNFACAATVDKAILLSGAAGHVSIVPHRREDQLPSKVVPDPALVGLARLIERQDRSDDRSDHTRVNQSGELAQLRAARLNNEELERRRQSGPPIGGLFYAPGKMYWSQSAYQ